MKTKTWALGLGLVLAVCAVLSIGILLPGEDAQRIEIISEGKVLYTLNLSVDQSVTVTTAMGTNTVTIQDGAVAVTAADCPDHYCMQRGWCRSGTDIVCLPHRLVIRFLGEQEIDGVAG